MTNINADSANDRTMQNQNIKMTRDQMQTQAMIIEALLSCSMALHDDESFSEALDFIEMAKSRALQLNNALDIVNAGAET